MYKIIITNSMLNFYKIYYYLFLIAIAIRVLGFRVVRLGVIADGRKCSADMEIGTVHG